MRISNITNIFFFGGKMAKSLHLKSQFQIYNANSNKINLITTSSAANHEV